MKGSYILGFTISALFATAPALAENDFRALNKVDSTVAMSETKLADVEGGRLRIRVGFWKSPIQLALGPAGQNANACSGTCEQSIKVKVEGENKSDRGSPTQVNAAEVFVLGVQGTALNIRD